MRLVASMIVKNELRRYLPLAVTHLLTYCDEIRVLDDNSTDNTFEFLRAIDRVEVLRNPGPAFFEHEGQARQNLLEWTFAGRPDYVLAIDADEFVGEPKNLLLSLDDAPAYTLTLVEAWAVSERGIDIRVDGLWGPRRIPILYKAPRHTDRHWRIADKKLACGREPLAVIQAARRAPEAGTFIFHFGWTNRKERQVRAERYFEHDQGKFHQDRHLQSILYEDRQVRMRRQPWPPGLKELAPDLIAYSDR